MTLSLVLPTKQRRLRIGAGALLAAVLGAGPVRAEAGPAATRASLPAPAATPSSAPAPVTTPSETDHDSASRDSVHERAAELYGEAEALYGKGETARALDAMQRSFELSGHPELLFNIGQLERELHDCPAALKSFDAYLARATHGTHRAEVQRITETLRTQCPEPPAPPAKSEPPATSPAPVVPAPVAPARTADPYWTPLRIAGWSTLGAALVTAAGAAYAAARAQTYEGRVEDRVSSEGASGSGYTTSDKALEQDGERAATWARALGITAAGLTAIGVSLIVVQPEKRPPASAVVSVSVGPGRAWVSCAF